MLQDLANTLRVEIRMLPVTEKPVGPGQAVERVSKRLVDFAVIALTRHPILLLGVYFLLQAGIRTYFGAPPKLDEAEQFAITHQLSYGYGPHPPLYQWIQAAAFHLVGANFLALALVKNAILFGTYSFLFLLGLQVTNDRRFAAIACFGLFFSTNFAWESQIDHTHTIASTFLVVATVYVTVLLTNRPTVALYVALGLAIGFGLIAKYNYILFLFALLFSCAIEKTSRKVILSPLLLLSLAIGVAIAFPHYLFIRENPGEALENVGKFGLDRFDFLGTRSAGLASIGLALIGVHGLWLGLIGLGYVSQRLDPGPPYPEDGRSAAGSLVLRLWSTQIVIVLAFVLVSGVTHFRDHWLQPEAVFFPLAGAVFFARFIDERLFRPLAAMTMAVMISLPVLIVCNKLLAENSPADAAMPDPAAIRQAIGDASLDKTRFFVLADSRRDQWYAAGHLRYWLQIPPPAFAPFIDRLPAGSVAIIFKTARKTSPSDLAHFTSADLSGYSPPVELPYFRPDSAEPDSRHWYISVRQ